MNKNLARTGNAILLLTALALASCAVDDHRQGPPGRGIEVVHPAPTKTPGILSCSGGAVCQIDVLIQGSTCIVAQGNVGVLPGVQIKWQVNDPHWKFRANGVEWKPSTPPASAAFDQPSAGGTSVFHWHVKPDAPKGTYPYGVHLTGPSGETCDFDPAIWV